MPFFADAGGVDGDETSSVFFETDINGVAGGAGDVADNDAIFTSEAVGKGAFADVAFADDGEFHGGFCRAFGGVGRQFFDDGFAEVLQVSAMQRRDAERFTETEAEKIRRPECPVWESQLCWRRPGWAMCERAEVGSFSGRGGVMPVWISTVNSTNWACSRAWAIWASYVLGKFVVIFDAETAGIDQFEIAVVGIDDGADAIAGDAGSWFDDADQFAGDGVEEAAFADVGSSYDCDYR